jgi:hypothetical protein
MTIIIDERKNNTVPLSEIVQQSFTQRQWLPKLPTNGKPDYSINARNLANCVALTQEIERLQIAHDGDDSPYEFNIDIINALHKFGFAGQATRKQKLAWYQMSVYLWASTQGQHGLSPIQLHKDSWHKDYGDGLNEFIESDDCSPELSSYIISHMCNHDDPGRASIWQIKRDTLARVERRDKELAQKDKRHAASLKAQRTKLEKKFEKQLQEQVAKAVAAELAKLQKPDSEPETAIGAAMAKKAK